MWKSSMEGMTSEEAYFCDPSRDCIRLVIHPDAFPDDISWDLHRTDGRIVRTGGAEGLPCVD